MIRLSTRYAALLLALAGAVAGLRLSLLQGAHGQDRCASPGALKATSLIPGTTALGERLESLDADTFQWSEGEVPNPVLAKLPMRFQIVRSYAPPKLYVNPLDFAAMPDQGAAGSDGPDRRRARVQPEDLRVRELPVNGGVLPIYVAWDHTEAPRGPSRLVAWFFAFDNEPVRSPLLSQLGNALNLALGGARPLTLVTISAVASEQTAAPVEAAAIAWLENAWAYCAHACAAR